MHQSASLYITFRCVNCFAMITKQCFLVEECSCGVSFHVTSWKEPRLTKPQIKLAEAQRWKYNWLRESVDVPSHGKLSLPTARSTMEISYYQDVGCSEGLPWKLGNIGTQPAYCKGCQREPEMRPRYHRDKCLKTNVRATFPSQDMFKKMRPLKHSWCLKQFFFQMGWCFIATRNMKPGSSAQGLMPVHRHIDQDSKYRQRIHSPRRLAPQHTGQAWCCYTGSNSSDSRTQVWNSMDNQSPFRRQKAVCKPPHLNHNFATVPRGAQKKGFITPKIIEIINLNQRERHACLSTNKSTRWQRRSSPLTRSGDMCVAVPTKVSHTSWNCEGVRSIVHGGVEYFCSTQVLRSWPQPHHELRWNIVGVSPWWTMVSGMTAH